MDVFSWDDILHGAAGIKPRTTALTVGGFDGPHEGHRALCLSVIQAAKERHLQSAVVTFTRSPRSFKQKADYSGDISSLRLRLKVFEQWGFSFAVVIDFSIDFSKIKGIDFLRILAERCGMCFFSVGETFRCGYQNDVGKEEIAAFAAENGIEFVPLQSMEQDAQCISSSAVRKAVVLGDLERAKLLLGRPFEIDCMQFCQNTGDGGIVLTDGKALPDDSGSVLPDGSGVLKKNVQLLPPCGTYRVSAYPENGANGALFFSALLHRDDCALRLEVPAAYKNLRLDKVAFSG